MIALKIAIGNDHAALPLKQVIIEEVERLGFAFEDFGAYSSESVDYPDYARKVGEAVAGGEFDLGIIACGTGIGMSIAANKVRGIRAALCHDVYSAKMARQHNDSNILALGARVIGPDLAREIIRTWLTTEFEGGRHQRRIDKVAEMEAEKNG